ncbi:hypothetical protein VI817_002445 [Penicillium citrinum]|nr:hypothetical protein VI817_002445 [Penicillium citrinum]
MSNLMHKVKDAVTGHHDQRGSSHESSQMSHKTDGKSQSSKRILTAFNSPISIDTRVDHGGNNYNSSAMGSEARNTSSINPQDTSIFSSNKGNTDSSYASNNMNPSTNATTGTAAYGSNAMDSTGNYGSGGYGSGTRHDPRMADPMQGIQSCKNTTTDIYS